MRFKSILITLLLGSTIVLSQTAPVVTSTEQLSTSEVMALKYLQQENSQLQSDVMGFQKDIAKEHPGYYFNFNTNTLDKVPPAPKAPEPKKEDKK